MKQNLKRALAIAALAPMALLAPVGPAGAGVNNVDPEPDISVNGDDVTIRCVHPLDDDLFFDVVLNTEGPNGGDLDDIDGAVIRAVDQDWDGGTYDTTDDIDVKSAKLEFFDDDADLVLDDHPDRIYRDTERVRRWKRGAFYFNPQRDDVGFVRATVRWYSPVPDDDDGEELTCVAYDPRLPAQPNA